MKNFRRTKLVFNSFLPLSLTLVFFIFCLGREGDRETQLLAIKGGTILTMAGERIEEGVVLIKGKKILAVGKEVEIPEEAAIFDAQGKHVLPGIIDSMTYYGIRPFDLNDMENPVTPENRIIFAYYPFGEFMRGKEGINRDREILSGGVTSVYIAPGDRQVIGGQGAVVKTWAESYDELILREPAALDMTIGDTAKYEMKREAKTPVTRMGISTLIRTNLLQAQEYLRKKKEAEEKEGEEKEKSPLFPRDPRMEALAALLNQEIPARIEADFADDIRTALRIADEFGFKLIIDSGLGAYKLKETLAEKGIPVVLGPPTHPFVQGGEVSMTRELYREMNEYNASELIKAGVLTSLASFGFGFGRFGYATQGRWLLIEAAYLAGFGVPDEEVLKMITINAAQILGVDDRVGSIEAGKDADLIILDGYPLDIKTWVDEVFIDGVNVYSRKGGRK